ncbi:MAG TPA: FUSC family protein [Terriglobia bacterium]|nr:FUSC family protein [Terriglobia bacterium]
MVDWIQGKDNPSTILHSVRTTVAAMISILLARLLRMPDAYWASISALIVMQSTLGAAFPVSMQRFAGTALGAGVGGLVATYYPGNIIAFGLAVLAVGIFCSLVRVERAAYRYAGITLAIVILITRNESAWTAAAHRFIEVSLGIVVGLAMTAAWPERRSELGLARNAGN